MNTPHMLARMADQSPRGYNPRPTQHPASNSTARKRDEERRAEEDAQG